MDIDQVFSLHDLLVWWQSKKVDWGTVPDWLAGAGSMLALIFAAIAVRAAKRSNDAQSAQLEHLKNAEDERVLERKRAQASKITSWVALDRVSSQRRPEVCCFNDSGSPVYDMTVTCHTPYGATETLYAVKVPDTEPKAFRDATESLIEKFKTGSPSAPDWRALYRNGDLRVSIKFRDSEGRWWTRDETGRLSEAF